MRIALLVIMLAAFSGCGKAPTPTLAGGQPVSHWVEAMHSSDASMRKEAVFKLGNVGPSDPASLPTVLGALKDKDGAVRSEAILALVKFGDQAREGIPALTELRDRDRDPKVRSYAAKALEKLK